MAVLWAISFAGKAVAEDAKPVGTQEDGFKKIVEPFFKAHCVTCHGTKKSEGKLTLHTLDPEKLGGADAKLWGTIIEQLEFAEMPPEEEPQPTEGEIEELTDWIKSELAAAGHESDIEHKLIQPSYANRINHQKLFDGSVKGPAFSPPRLWRLHPEGYDGFLKGFGILLNSGGPLTKPFTVGDGKGEISNYAALMRADAATLGQLMLNCRQIAQMQTIGFRRMEKDRKTQKMIERITLNRPKTFEAIIVSADDPTDVMMAAAVAEEFNFVLSRDPSSKEAADYGDLLKRSIEVGGRERGLRTMAMAVLMRPEAIYRMEVGLGETDEHGRRMLSPYELAHAIAYALTDTPPDRLMLGKKGRHAIERPSLMDLAREGKLESREEVRAVVMKLWENDLVKKPRILRFFHEFFGYHAATAVFKGDRAGGEFATSHLVRDADRLVMHIVNNDRDVLEELLTTDRYFFGWPGSKEAYDKQVQYIVDRIKPDSKHPNNDYFIRRTQEEKLRPIPQANPAWRETARFYNLDPKTWNYPTEQPFQMPRNQRVGILTHPAWLVAWSGNFGNDPIHRGKWIREHLLAGSISEVPIEVDAKVPEDPHKTLRQRLEVTREDYCWKCHKKMEPLGLPLETYNDFGQYRTKEGLGPTRALEEPKQTAPVVKTGQIIDSGDASIDGDVRDVHELMRKLAGSARVRQSFVRHAFRYWMGRNEMLSDSPTLIAADRAYVAGSGSFKAMVIELLTSDSFLYRK
jgi:mono/diheme cytochrome c family protein